MVTFCFCTVNSDAHASNLCMVFEGPYSQLISKVKFGATLMAALLDRNGIVFSCDLERNPSLWTSLGLN